MSTRPTQHYCKHCQTSFHVRLHEDETGDFFLECPECKWPHYRRFEGGQAVHTELKLARSKPVTIRGQA
jgi:hypothetical protein